MKKYKKGDVFIDNRGNKYFITSFDSKTVWYVAYYKRLDNINFDGAMHIAEFEELLENKSLFPDTNAGQVLYGVKNEL